MKLYNSLTRKLETFEPIASDKPVGVYTCGPTVYSYVTIGNWRSYTLSDILVRTLNHFGYKTKYIMNITDVGHLTGDNLGDADTGEDRLEKAAKSAGKTAWQIAEMYTKDFLEGFDQLNLTQPEKFTKATEYIQEQIELVQSIEVAGFAYKITDGIYFDVSSYEEAGHDYGQLSNIDQVKEGARVEPNPEKKDPRDFALWKFSKTGEQRHMEWDSPWGIGFPGWHIECSAMSIKHLGQQFDIHVGGEDLRSTHHPNEIAQSEAATGKKPFVKYWLHGAFLLVDGGRMGKSLGNAYTLHDLSNKGFDPLALRYFYLTSHYRKQQNFTWESLEGAATALSKLRKKIQSLGEVDTEIDVTALAQYQDFSQALADDLNLPQALATVWETLRDSEMNNQQKRSLIETFDQVLGLKLTEGESHPTTEIPAEITKLVELREKHRQDKDFEKADQIRDQINQLGFEVKDGVSGPEVKPLSD